MGRSGEEDYTAPSGIYSFNKELKRIEMLEKIEYLEHLKSSKDFQNILQD